METGTPIRLSKRRKALSLALKAVVILSSVIGTYLSYAAGRGSFMGGRQVFMYFTIQSNILMAILCLAGVGFLLQKHSVPAWWILAILLFLLGVGTLYLKLLNALQRKLSEKQSVGNQPR